ncbi:putative glutathione S-transferase theta-1, partial [Apostichopus japonicus]
ENRTAEFAEINPRKKLPALKDGDFNLSESVAMVRYIANKYRDQIADHWYPKDLKQRARVDEYLEYQHLGTRLHYSLLFIHELTAMRTGQTPDTKQTAKLETNMKKITHIVQKTFLGDNKFLCGDEITIADIFAVHEILQIVGTGHDPVTDNPKLAAWMERVSHKLNPHFAETLVEIYAMGGKEIPPQLKSKY